MVDLFRLSIAQPLHSTRCGGAGAGAARFFGVLSAINKRGAHKTDRLHPNN